MKKKLILIPLCLFLLLLVFCRPLPVVACSCMELPPPDEALTNATAVFSGEVIAIKDSKGIYGEIGKTVSFKVREVWKGDNGSDISVVTGSDSASCGLDFIIGKEYIVYAHASDMYGKTVLSSTLCDRTTELKNATDDISMIGQSQVPKQSEKTAETYDANYLLYAGFIFVAGLVGIFTWTRMRKTKK